MPHRSCGIGHSNLQRVILIAHHARRIKAHAPRREKPSQGGTATCVESRHWICWIVTQVGFGKGVDESNQPSAPQHKLVNLVTQGLRNFFRMNQEQQVDVPWQFFAFGRYGLDIEKLIKLAREIEVQSSQGKPQQQQQKKPGNMQQIHVTLKLQAPFHTMVAGAIPQVGHIKAAAIEGDQHLDLVKHLSGGG